MRKIATVTAGVMLAACAAWGGPYSNERGGVSATGAVFRGWINGYVSFTQPDPDSGGFAHDNAGLTNSVDPIGRAIVGRPSSFTLDGATQHVLSLGNGGSIVLTLDAAICDGAGPDFAVFENGFTDNSAITGTTRAGATNTFAFAELAYVEVASETSAWVRFPSVCLNTQVLFTFSYSTNRFASQDVTLVDGLAGKHRIEFGTPFDLSLLTNAPEVLSGQVDLHCIRYVRITDVIGDGSTLDSAGRPIYDPYYDEQEPALTPAYPVSTDGFDLRAVGVINSPSLSIQPGAAGIELSWYAARGATYRVQASDSLGAAWTDLGDRVEGDRAVHCAIDPNGASAIRMYKLCETRTEGP